MSAVEEIQAAIDKLAALKAESTQPTGGRTSWMQGDPKRDRYEGRGDIYTGPVDHESGDVATSIFNEVDAELIVTLHRTIDAQLAILREVDFQLAGSPERVTFSGDEYNLFVALARAINGGTR